MSDNKNKPVNGSKPELSVKEGDIVWHIADKCICEVLSVRIIQSQEFIYVAKIAGCNAYNNEITQDGIELILPKEQIHYEVITSENTIQAFYKGKMVLNLVFEFKVSIMSASRSLNAIERSYICNQLMEMYPNSKISKAIEEYCYIY